MSDEKTNLPSRLDIGGKSVQLHDNGLKAGSLLDQSLAYLTREQAQNIMAKATEERIRLEVKSREQNLDYVTGTKAVEDHIGAWSMLDKSGHLTRQRIESNVKIRAGDMRIESKSGPSCSLQLLHMVT